MEKKLINDLRINRHGNYMREFSGVHARSEGTETAPKMIVEGQPIVFNQETILFTYEGIDYKEIIDTAALNNTDISECFLKFNHDDNHVVARTKNKSLELEIKPEGVGIKAELVNTQAGRDMYELVRTGIIDKMSFAFTIEEESYNKETHTWTVRKIGKLYDVAAVAHPAYEQTEIYARRLGEVEASRKKELDDSIAKEKVKLENRRKDVLARLENIK
jgi:hypothetical protein